MSIEDSCYPQNTIQALRNHLFTTLRRFEESFPDKFAETSLNRCPECDGTGLIVQRSGEITVWMPDNYCARCKGIGYLGVERVGNLYLCPGNNCTSYAGCNICKGRGLVDWITYIMKKGEKNNDN